MAKQKYRAVARLKGGPDEGDIERGEFVKASDVRGEENLEALVASGSIMTEADFNAAFPRFDAEAEEGANQPAGTPSNLEQVEGTELESPEGQEAAEAEAAANLEQAKADAEAAAEAAKKNK
jgi:hypothetical protein